MQVEPRQRQSFVGEQPLHVRFEPRTQRRAREPRDDFYHRAAVRHGDANARVRIIEREVRIENAERADALLQKLIDHVATFCFASYGDKENAANFTLSTCYGPMTGP